MNESPDLVRRGLLASAASLITAPVFGNAYPSRPITVICPFTAGGTADSQLRALAAAASKTIGQQVIVDNRPGVAGTLGPSSLVTAAPDGYTLSLATAIALLRQPFINKTRYDPAKDFTYVIGVTGFELGLVVRADSPWRNVLDFIRDAKRSPDKIVYATAGIATGQHVAMLQFAEKLGVSWTHIPFKGASEVYNALAGGHVPVISETSGWAPFVDAGKFRLLAVFADQRLPRWPDVPTLKELGYDVSASVPWGIVGPANMDRQVVQVLHGAFQKAMGDAAFKHTLDTLGQLPWGADSESYRKFMLSRIPVERELVARYRLAQEQ
jgi:tripartite-type tricarboxylate transporter receptor subunit TctC